MRTDEEILQLFARANPRPRTGAAAPPREARYLKDLEERSIDMTDTKIPTSKTREADRKPSRRLLVAAVVAIAVVAAGFMLLDGPGEEQTELAAPTDSPIDLAYRIVEARNAFDADALSDLIGPAEYGFLGRTVDIIGFAGWAGAFDWRFVDSTCEQTTDSQVVCSYTVSNRLTRHAGLEGEVDGTLNLFFTAGALTSASESADLTTSGYANRAFGPFFEWVGQNHGEAVEVMWDTSLGAVPRLTEESVRLFDEMLTEYTGEG